MEFDTGLRKYAIQEIYKMHERLFATRGNAICEELASLIPKNKFDFEPFPELMLISEEKVMTILPGLLFCIADMNWPIASEMVKVLARFPNSVVPFIKEILKPAEMDEDWKSFIISGLIPELPREAQALLMEDVQRISCSPTRGEIGAYVNEVAGNYIKGVKKNLSITPAPKQ